MAASPIYVQVFRDKVRVHVPHTGGAVEKFSLTPFSTTRLLVGQFDAFEATLKAAFTEVGVRSWWKRAPDVLVQAMDGFGGDVSQVEARVLVEGCLGAGANKAYVHPGRLLDLSEVASAFEQAAHRQRQNTPF